MGCWSDLMGAPAKTYGTLWLEGDYWHLQADPHVAMWAKRIFMKVPAGINGVIKLSNNPAVCRDLEWFLHRFPLEVPDKAKLTKAAAEHVDHIKRLDQIIDPNYQPRQFEMALPAREYQRRAAELFLAKRSLLLADDLGLGKTASAIAALMEPSTLPAIVVCLAHLPRQWEREINRFAPGLHTHILKKSQPYELPRRDGCGPDVVITSYHKLDGWRTALASYGKSVIFDECQELRRSGSNKHYAASTIAKAVGYRLGLSATPIYNYGGEIFNVMDILSPGVMGTRSEFLQEWCTGHDDKASLKDPAAFGSFAREQHLMLRRTRRDVGRELPDLQRITHTIDCDEKALKAIEGRAGELARTILSETVQARGVKMHAAEEFSNVLRQATGISKSPYVAEFVRMLLENGEPVVLFGWHRAVYEIWLEKLKEFRPAIYTGSESASAKDAAAKSFIEGQTDLLIVSLRSGAGLDGLQKRCRTVVFGELDWSPGVHEQCTGRIYRDGQAEPVAAYFLLADGGADPLMAETLGLKRDQIEGIRGREDDTIVQRNDSESAIRRLAEAYLKKVKKVA
jgi:SNF2 family DNA or RNA helicase